MDTMKPGDMNSDDLCRVNKAMKDPKFKDFMQEYWDEMTADGNREEYDKYLEQLEAKNELPPGTELLRSDPGCCVRTNMRFKSGQVQKLFLNICQSDLIEDISITTETGKEGEKGNRVSLPYSLGPPRPDKTIKNKDNCMTADFAVGTYTFLEIERKPQLLKMIVDIAASNLQRQFFKDHEEVMKDFTLLKNMKCKGGEPYMMSVQTEMLKKGKARRKAKRHGKKNKREELEQGLTPGELRTMKKEADEKRKAEETQSEEEDEGDSEEEEEEIVRVRVPKHKLIHQGMTNWGNFVESTQGPVKATSCSIKELPTNLKLVVELPTVKGADEIDIDVTEEAVVLEVVNRFYLDLPLPYKVDPVRGTAKFDKSRKPPTITFTLPVTEENVNALEQLEAVEPGATHDGDNLEGYESEEELKEEEEKEKEQTAGVNEGATEEPSHGESTTTTTTPVEDTSTAVQAEPDPPPSPLVGAQKQAETTSVAGNAHSGTRDVLDVGRASWMDIHGSTTMKDDECVLPAAAGDTTTKTTSDDCNEDEDDDCASLPALEEPPDIVILSSTDACAEEAVVNDGAVEERIEIEELTGPAVQSVGETRSSVILVFPPLADTEHVLSTVELCMFGSDTQVELRFLITHDTSQESDANDVTEKRTRKVRAFTSQCILHRAALLQWHWELRGGANTDQKRENVWVIIRKMDPEVWGTVLACAGPHSFERPTILHGAQHACGDEELLDGATEEDEGTDAKARARTEVELPKGSDATMGQGVLLRNRVFFELF